MGIVESEQKHSLVQNRAWELFVFREYLFSKKYLTYSEAEIKNYQSDTLRRIIAHAYSTVPFYKKYSSSAGLGEEAIRKITNLTQIPIISKSNLHSLGKEEVISSKFLNLPLLTFATGGTSGMLINLHFTPAHLQRRIAQQLRIYYLYGYSCFDKTAEFMYYPIKETFINKIGFFRRLAISHNLDIEQQAKTILSYQPNVLEGYPSRLNLLANYFKHHRIKYNPKFIVCNSESLAGEVADNIKNVFGKEPVDVYQSTEFGRVAWRCPYCRSYHINADTCIVEVLDDNGNPVQNSQGELVITDLNNYSMPLIRYKTGDIGTIGKNSCKIKLPVLSSICGRKSEYCILPDGTQAPSIAIMFLQEEGVDEYRIVQLARNELLVEMVLSHQLKPESFNCINEHFRSFGFTKVNFKIVDVLPRTKVQKLQRFICWVKNENRY